MNVRLFALIALGLASGCRPRVHGNGREVTVSVPVHAGFTRVSLSAGLRAVITVGPPASVRLVGDEALVPLVRVTSRGDLLTIEPQPGRDFSGETPVTAEISMPRLNGAEASGGASIDATGITVGSVRAGLSGGARATLSGAVDTLELDASGGARLDAEQLTARAVTIDASGGASATVHATAAITGTLSGGARLRVLGAPPSRAVQTSGGASVSYP